MNLTNLFIPLFFLAFIGMPFLLAYDRHKNNKKVTTYLVEQLSGKVVYKKQDVKADVYIYGRRNKTLLFNRCDIYVLSNAILLTTISNFLGYKMQTKPLIITKNRQDYDTYIVNNIVPEVMKINPDSFNNEVYIDYKVVGNYDVNVEIHLKGLSDKERNYFKI